MDLLVQSTAESLLSRVNDRHHSSRLVVAVAGLPGSGKTTLSQAISNQVNLICGRRICACVSLDGWHYSRQHLMSMSDPMRALEERGAAYTFDADAFVRFIQTLTSSSEAVTYPNFSHALKDPVQGGGTVFQTDEIVLVEGLYVNLDQSPWNEAVYDERWWIEAGTRAEVTERLVARHIRTGVCSDRREALDRGKDRIILSRVWLDSLAHNNSYTLLLQLADRITGMATSY